MIGIIFKSFPLDTGFAGLSRMSWIWIGGEGKEGIDKIIGMDEDEETQKHAEGL